MTVHCHRCGSSNLRPAHFRWMDIVYLAGLNSPVRCRYCRVRFYVSILKIGAIRREAEQRRFREIYAIRTEQMTEAGQQRIPDRS